MEACVILWMARADVGWVGLANTVNKVVTPDVTGMAVQNSVSAMGHPAIQQQDSVSVLLERLGSTVRKSVTSGHTVQVVLRNVSVHMEESVTSAQVTVPVLLPGWDPPVRKMEGSYEPEVTCLRLSPTDSPPEWNGSLLVPVLVCLSLSLLPAWTVPTALLKFSGPSPQVGEPGGDPHALTR
ncbi:hypothetical protein E1301_Tti011043 [Triplophysa tibetana]|uniref:Uncharacterized protein n=1 Tax=Triplophysa tibetana TaxID=1572043 RepID=A0A5A9MWH2_9TELE|nr:hypothetical protein E1301_Tti011043 [Triplophysa tibetana]